MKKILLTISFLAVIVSTTIGGCVIIDYGHLWCTLLLYIV